MGQRTAGAASGGGAARGAIAATAGAALTIGATIAWTPRPLSSVVGPPPFPAVLAGGSLLAAAAAGALVGRRLARTSGAPPARMARSALWTAVAYLLAVTATAAAFSVAAQGPVALLFPFGLAAYGIAVSLLLAPWAALPVLCTAVALERWTRPLAGGAGTPSHVRRPGRLRSVLPPRRAP
jgi:hypothetical protein